MRLESVSVPEIASSWLFCLACLFVWLVRLVCLACVLACVACLAGLAGLACEFLALKANGFLFLQEWLLLERPGCSPVGGRVALRLHRPLL